MKNSFGQKLSWTYEQNQAFLSREMLNSQTNGRTSNRHQTIESLHSSDRWGTANNFEIKPSLVGMVQHNQFSGLPIEHLNFHFSILVKLYGTLKSNGTEENAIQLILFPFSLRYRARVWLQSLPANSITTWPQIKVVFLARYFSSSKLAQVKSEINNFRQEEESISLTSWSISKTYWHCARSMG